MKRHELSYYLSYTCYRLYCKIEICLFDIIIELWISAQYLFAYYQLFIYLLVRCCNACLNKCYLLKNILFTKTYISTIYNAHHFTKFYVKLVLTLLTCVGFRMTKNPKNFGAYGVNVRPYSVARSATVAILAASFHQIRSKKPFLQWKFEVTYLVYDRYILLAQISKIGIFVLVTVKRESLMNFTTRKKKFCVSSTLYCVCIVNVDYISQEGDRYQQCCIGVRDFDHFCWSTLPFSYIMGWVGFG